MSAGYQYTIEEVVTKLRKHLIDDMGSYYTMHKPSHQAITKRMKKDEELRAKVEDVVNEANHKWWRMGLKALVTDNTNFNTNLFKYYTQNKKPFIDHLSIQLEERITELENAKPSR